MCVFLFCFTFSCFFYKNKLVMRPALGVINASPLWGPLYLYRRRRRRCTLLPASRNAMPFFVCSVAEIRRRLGGCVYEMFIDRARTLLCCLFCNDPSAFLKTFYLFFASAALSSAPHRTALYVSSTGAAAYRSE